MTPDSYEWTAEDRAKREKELAEHTCHFTVKRVCFGDPGTLWECPTCGGVSTVQNGTQATCAHCVSVVITATMHRIGPRIGEGKMDKSPSMSEIKAQEVRRLDNEHIEDLAATITVGILYNQRIDQPEMTADEIAEKAVAQAKAIVAKNRGASD